MPQYLRDSSIWAGPFEPDRVHTLSAEKSSGGLPRTARPSPTTDCDDPYIGEESIKRPPLAKKLCMTSAREARASASSPTLKVIQVPRPTRGRASPDDGIGLVIIGPACARTIG